MLPLLEIEFFTAQGRFQIDLNCLRTRKTTHKILLIFIITLESVHFWKSFKAVEAVEEVHGKSVEDFISDVCLRKDGRELEDWR